MIATMVIKLDSQHTLYPDEILEGYSCDLGKTVRVDIRKRGLRRKCFGMICDPRYPARVSDIQKFRDLGANTILTPITWFTTKTPFFEGKSPVLIFERPKVDGPVFGTLDDTIPRINHNWIIDNLLVPNLRLLERLSDTHLTHRAIMPTNIFADTKMNRAVTIGQCFTSPAGTMQQSTFELRHYAIAERFGRGPGSWQNDVFALGVTALSLFLGRVPCRDMSANELNIRRMNMSPLHLYTDNAKIPERFMVLLRGMLQDNPASMMTIPELLDWIFKRRSSSHSAQAQRFTTALRYRKIDHRSLQSLAHTLSLSWDDARMVLSSDRVISWVTRSIPHQYMPKGLTDRMKQLNEMDPHSTAMELAIAKILVLMDRDAPIRLPGYHVMPDALLSHASTYIDNEEVLTRLYYVLRNELFSFWVDQQIGEGQESSLSSIFSFQSGLTRSNPHQTIELLFYDYYPDLPCRSPIVQKSYVLSASDLLWALDESVEGRVYDENWFPLDRHIHAFLRSRSTTERISIPWRNLSEANPYTRRIAEMGVIVSVQNHLKIAKLNNLFEYTRGLLLEVSSRIKLQERRERLSKQLRSLRNNGNLQSLMLLWRGGALFQQDSGEFNQALQHYRGYIMREKSLLKRRDQVDESSRRLANNISALIGSATSLGGLLLLLVLAL